MILLVSGATQTVARYTSTGRLGALLTPAAGNPPPRNGLPWAADNSAFSGFDAPSYCRLLGSIAGKPGCLFVCCPDIVRDSRSTLALFDRWQPILAELQLPVALVLQDGAEALDLPWGRTAAVFIGGSTEWKLSQAAGDLIREARQRRKHVHMGRVNTRRRIAHAAAVGVDSIDGSGFSRWPDTLIPEALEWLAASVQDRNPSVRTGSNRPEMNTAPPPSVAMNEQQPKQEVIQ